MTAQYFTIIKLGGTAADAALVRLQTWLAARRCEDPNEWTPDQWPPEMRREIDAFAERLRRHAHEPPILFYAEFVDHWSSPPIAHYPIPEVMGDRYEISFCELPLAGELQKRFTLRARRGQHFEDRFFAQITLAAEAAWPAMTDRQVLLILRNVFGSLTTDEEIDASLKTVPAWINDPA